MKFKSGDKVVCIDAEGREELAFNSVYTIREYCGDWNEYSLVETDEAASFYEDRFILLEDHPRKKHEIIYNNKMEDIINGK